MSDYEFRLFLFLFCYVSYARLCCAQELEVYADGEKRSLKSELILNSETMKLFSYFRLYPTASMATGFG
jgi:hypothetical protein